MVEGSDVREDVVVEVAGLRKSYGALVAVDDLSFSVQRGEIFAMVGPNGAGKTTTIECIQGQREFEGGRVRVLGLDPARDRRRLNERIGVQLQATALPPRMKVWEALDLFRSFYRRRADPVQLLELLGLAEKRDSFVYRLSGGQRQRLHVALALINEPEVLFLDELTTGLDPQARRLLWDLMSDLRRRGRTIFLTTHFMEEAERLADRVAVIDHGRLVALDTPRNLIRQVGAEERLSFELEGDFDIESLARLPSVSRVDRTGGRITVCGHDRLLSRVVRAVEDQGARLVDLRPEPVNLEDVFLAITGRALRG